MLIENVIFQNTPKELYYVHGPCHCPLSKTLLV